MRDKESTRKMIIEVGKKMFIEKGYDNAYLRDIAKESGVTTGAIYGHYKDKDTLFRDIVLPVIEGFKESLACLQDEYRSIDNEQLNHDPMTLNSHDPAIDYIFDHHDEFILLLKCAHETSMKDWFEDFIKTEVMASQSYAEKWKDAGVLKSDIDVRFIEIVSSSYFHSIFEAVSKGMSREETKKLVTLLSIYYTGGWKALAESSALAE